MIVAPRFRRQQRKWEEVTKMPDLAHEQLLKQAIGAIVGTERRFQEVLAEVSGEERDAWIERLNLERAGAGIDYVEFVPMKGGGEKRAASKESVA